MKVLALALMSVCAMADLFFVEDFSTELDESRFKLSADDKFAEGDWSIQGEDAKTIVVGAEAKHHAISAAFSGPLDPAESGIVIQYEVRFSKRHECGGAYIKVLQHDDDFTPSGFKDDTPYIIMFGPDKCGTTDKVHFIFRHKNPLTGEYEEKHMTGAPKIKNDLITHLYTLVVRPDSTFEMFVDQESVKAGSLLEEFEPPVNPPKEIDDPTDLKPEDWVDEEMMDDPNESKPEDWDEDAPMYIDDMDAVKPEGWDDDGEELIPDPEAEMPEDWDEEDDGEWEAPTIKNPVCMEIGCGEWTRPTISNPEFKGTWVAPQVVNPDYKGVWKAKQIPNPDFFEDLQPHAMTPMGGVGIELWTMQSGIHFSNIVVDSNLEAAQEYATETWRPKFDADTAANAPPSQGLNDILALIQDNIMPFAGTMTVLIVGLVYFCLCRGDSEDDEEDEEEGEEEGEDAPKVTLKEAEDEDDAEEEEKKTGPKLRRSARRSKKAD